MAAYYLAPALAVLRDEINARWPNRDKASDGWIGDRAHQATRSDHNPNDRGSVNALDIDRDGVDVPAIIAAIEAHPSAHYWIFNRQIADRDDGWRPRPYTGSNPHTLHLHISIRQSRTAEQDRRPWGLEETMTPAQFVAILKDPTVASLMRALPWQYVGGGIPKGKSTLGVLAETHRAVTGDQDPVDEAAIVAGVLAGLAPERLAEQIAAHLPADHAARVVDELAARLQGQARE
ncbi:hypothetical protein ACQSSU_03190 [Micromonospora echinospora]